MVTLTRMDLYDYNTVTITSRLLDRKTYEFRVLVSRQVVTEVVSKPVRLRYTGPRFLGDTDLTEAYVNAHWSSPNRYFETCTNDMVRGIPYQVTNTDHFVGIIDIVDLSKNSGHVFEWKFSLGPLSNQNTFLVTFEAKLSSTGRALYRFSVKNGPDWDPPIQPGLPSGYWYLNLYGWEIISQPIQDDEIFLDSRDLEYLDLVKAPRAVLKQTIDQRVLVNCVNSASRVNINTLEYATDLGELMSLVRPLQGALPSNLKEALKFSSGVFLTIKYGWENLFRDTVALGDSAADIILNRGLSTTRSGESITYLDPLGNSWTYDSYCIIQYDQVDDDLRNQMGIIDSLTKKANDYGFGTASSFWDTIPFSFVVDWFVNLGKALEMVDARNYAVRLPVSKCVTTYRYKRTGNTKTLGWLSCPSWLDTTGEIQVYRRHIGSTVPEILPSVTHTSKGPLTHWAEGSALILQKFL